jgi:hypothetical protein
MQPAELCLTSAAGVHLLCRWNLRRMYCACQEQVSESLYLVSPSTHVVQISVFVSAIIGCSDL